MKNTEDEKYIKKRKRKASLFSLLFYAFWILPINKNKITFSSYEGDGGYCCNPRYIAEELHRRHPEYKMIWLLHDTEKKFPDWILPVKDTAINTAYHLSTSKVWVDNYRKPYGTKKRKGQLYIQTWHASIGFKAVGLYRGDAFPKIARIVSEWDSSLIDYVISNSKYCDEIYPKKLLYNGPTIRSGSPRVDPLINNKTELRIDLRHTLQLDESIKLLLFAPTFRGGNQQGVKNVVAQVPAIDFELLIQSIEKKYSGEWRILLRLHPQLAAKMDEMKILQKDERMIDVSQLPDMSEILGGVDMLITDYSSCAFDAAFAGIPALIYADDIQEYTDTRGNLMWEKDELPFDIALTNDELFYNIETFNMDRYMKKTREFMIKHGIEEDGHASERVVDFILGWRE